ncbi:MAG: dipicolinate synthase subunit DpsA [Oscillospiraceae bacterium]
MKEPNRFLTIGGDVRQIYTTQCLNERGFIANAYGFDTLKKVSVPRFEYSNLKTAINYSDAIVLPLPTSRDGISLNCPYSVEEIMLDEILKMLRPKQFVFGGMVSKNLRSQFLEHNLLLFDYFEREELIVKNAVPTAQGVIKLIMEELPITVHGSKIAVTGFGRTSRVLVRMLKGLGADVTVVARNLGDLAFVEIEGCRPVTFADFDKKSIKLDIIINTVPALVLDEQILRSLKKDCLIIEIASAPFGIDFEKAETLGLRVIQAGSLPGKAAPKTAGEIIADAILNIIKEEIT